MSAGADEVLDQWDIMDADDLVGAIGDAIAVAADYGADQDGVDLRVHVVPDVAGATIAAGVAITGLKVARINGAIGIYLFAEVDA